MYLLLLPHSCQFSQRYKFVISIPMLKKSGSFFFLLNGYIYCLGEFTMLELAENVKEVSCILYNCNPFFFLILVNLNGLLTCLLCS